MSYSRRRRWGRKKYSGPKPKLNKKALETSAIKQFRRRASDGFVTRFSLCASNGTSASRSWNKFAYTRFTSPEQTVHAVRLALTLGIRAAAERLKVNFETLHTWVKLRRPQKTGKYSAENLRRLVVLAMQIQKSQGVVKKMNALQMAAKRLDMKWSSLAVHFNMECVATPANFPIYQDPDAQSRMERLWNGTGNGSPLADLEPYPDDYFVNVDPDRPVALTRPKPTCLQTVPPESVASSRQHQPALQRPRPSVAPVA